MTRKCDSWARGRYGLGLFSRTWQLTASKGNHRSSVVKIDVYRQGSDDESGAPERVGLPAFMADPLLCTGTRPSRF